MVRMSVSRAISWLAAEHPESIAVRDDHVALTWRELDRRTNRLARAYAELGVGVDSLVTVALPNSVEFVEACVAVWKLGATPQPLSYRLPPAEIAAVLALAEPALVVGLPPDAEASAGVPLARSDRLVENCRFEATPPTDFDESIAGERRRARPAARLGAGFVPSAELSNAAMPDAAARSWKAPTSSGSTGRPSLILAAASAHIDPEGRVAAFIPRRAVQLVSGPLYHSAPFTYAMRGLMTGHTLVILPRFDEHRWLEAIGRHSITWAPLVPTMMHRIGRLPAAERDAADLRSLESILHIGSVCPPTLKRAWIDWIGPERVTEVYAGAESQGLTVITGSEWLEHPGSVGRPSGGSEFAIWGADDRPLPAGATGRIMMRRSGGATYAYRGAAARQHPDGWDTLGDLGHLDAEGYLYIADRADDLIITGGVNVYPAEVEAALEQHPRVRSAVVFGVPDPAPNPDPDPDPGRDRARHPGPARDREPGPGRDRARHPGPARDREPGPGAGLGLGEVVAALVDVGGEPPHASEPLTEAALLDWLQGRLDPEKRPRRIEFTTEPVRDDAGKARRHLLGAAHDHRTGGPRPIRRE